MKKSVLSACLLLSGFILHAQTTYFWRNDQNPTSGQWNVANYWWNGSGPELPGGAEILSLDGSVGTVMTNDLPSSNRYIIRFVSAGASRTVNGSTPNTFFDYSNNIPAIFNGTGNLQTINFPVRIGNTSTVTSPNYGFEINASSGGITFGSNASIAAANNSGGKVLVLRASSGGTGTITLNGVISDGAGNIALSKIENNTVVLGALNTYTGATFINAGTVQAGISQAGASGPLGNNSDVRIAAGASLNLNNNNATVYVVRENGSGNGGTISLGSGTLTISGGWGALTYYQNSISGTNGSLVKQGTGTLSLYGSQSFTGSTTISGGELSASVALSSGSYTINGGTFRISNANLIPDAANVILSSGSFAVDYNETINNLTISGGTLNVAAGRTLTINGTLSLNGSATINLNGTGKIVYGTSGKLSVGIPYTTTTDIWPATLSEQPKDVTIAANVILHADRTVANSLTLSSGTFSIGSNTLTVDGAISGSGTLSGSSTSNLSLGGTAGILSFTPATASLNNLTLTTAVVSATLGSALNVYGNIQLNGGNLDLAGQQLTLKSGSAGTATIDQLVADGSNLQNATNVTVERWIPLRNTGGTGSGTGNNGRAYRVLGSTVTTTSAIAANWMEGGMNTVVGNNTDPRPLYGTQVSGSNGNAGGFDVTQTNAPSLFTFTPGSNIIGNIGYPAVTNVGAGSILNAQTGYFLYMRGDRSMSMQEPYNPLGGMPASSTTLRATGTLQKGFINYTISNTTGNFTLVTNPYPAPIDWNAVALANTGSISPFYTFWNPNTGLEGAFEVGSVVSHRYIQPGQAFFVQSLGGSATLTLNETMKAVGNNDVTVYFGNTSFESFSVELKLTEANNFKHTADGILVRYGNTYSAGVDVDDAEEINNWKENIAISRNATRLAVESRPVIQDRDTIFLFMNKMRQAAYEFEFTPSMFTNTGLVAELIDNYLNKRTLLSVANTVNVTFTVNADAGSSATDRFMVVFSSAGPLPIDAITINAQAKNGGVQVEWSSKTERDMDRYEVERSANGILYNNFKTTTAVGNSPVPVSYSWFDAAPLTGNNFYRIRAYDKNGVFKYSQVVNVTIGKGQPMVAVTPNPVTNNEIGLKLANLDKGSYTLLLYSSSGQLVFSTIIQHPGGSAYKPVLLNNKPAAGNYQLLLSGPDGVKYQSVIVVN